jgi:hypothetical protein
MIKKLRPVSNEQVVDGGVVRSAGIKLDSERCNVLSLVHLKEKVEKYQNMQSWRFKSKEEKSFLNEKNYYKVL